MPYTFDIVGVSPVLNFMGYQQQVGQAKKPSKAYLGSSQCTLDAFMRSADFLPQRPAWNWDEVMAEMVNFWLVNEERVRFWKTELAIAGEQNLLVACVANVEALRGELERLWGQP